jgi:hyperosmotically inducible protein
MLKGQIRKLTVSLLMVSGLCLSAVTQALANPAPQGVSRTHIIREVRHELVTLPYYGVFDWLEFEVNSDNSVTLRGQVVRPSTKSDAGGRVKDVDGVTNVNNEIEVLPVSPNDDRLRVQLYRAIYGSNSPLFRYAHQAVPSIHIIVKRGRATLKGVVANRGDSNLAYIRARGVPGAFEVKNELIVESERPT